MSSVTRGPSCDHRHPVNSYSIVAWSNFFQASSLYLYIYCLLSLLSVSLTFSFDITGFLFFILSAIVMATHDTPTPRVLVLAILSFIVLRDYIERYPMNLD